MSPDPKSRPEAAHRAESVLAPPKTTAQDAAAATTRPTPAAAEDDAARARTQGLVALLAVQVFFGLFPLFGKLAMHAFAPRVVAGWRITVGATVLLGIAFAKYGRAAWPRRGDWLRLQVCALLGIALNQVLYLEGLQRAPSVNAALVMALIPVFVFVLSVVLRLERLVPARALGLALSVVGMGILLMRKRVDLGPEYLAGNLLMTTNAFSYSVYLVLAKPLAMRMPSLVLTAWVFGLSVWTVPLFALGYDWAPASADRGAWLSLVYVLVFPTILAYLLNAYALARVSASTTAIFIFMQPMIAAVAGRVGLHEQLDATFGLAAALILGGLWVVLRWRSR
ncbi:MAG: DMT family transporter [Planctomycetota bacterium]